MMRVAIIHPFLFRYARGIERFTLNLANALARREEEVHLLTWRWRDPIRIGALDRVVRVREFPTGRYFAAQFIVPFYAWDLLTGAYDFIWIFFAGYGEAEALTLVRRQKFGIAFHYPLAQVPHRYQEFRRYGLIDRAAQIASVSQHVADGVREFCGRASAVIHHGVDASQFAPDPSARARVRAELNIAPDAPLLVTVAALEERKGVQRVLCALPLVLGEFPGARYLILGEGPYRAALEQLARELNLATSVHFLGATENAARYFQAADLSLILARGEASSLSALESLACGVPVIAAGRPPFDELIQPGYGLMVNEASPREVGGAILGLLQDSVRRRAMGEVGRTRVIADFSWERAAAQYVKLMETG